MCDICGSSAMVGVAASVIGPMSQAYCSECLANSAEPEWAFEYTYEITDNGAEVAPWVSQLSTWKDGKYLTWDEWLAWRNSGGKNEQ